MRVILSWINHFWICWTTVWYALPANIFYLIGSILVQTWSKITCLWTRRIMNHLILKKRVLEKYGPDHIKLVWKMDQISGPETRPIYYRLEHLARHRAILNCGLKFQTTGPDWCNFLAQSSQPWVKLSLWKYSIRSRSFLNHNKLKNSLI